MPPVSPTPSRLDTLIAIPVRNEAERIARCLTAIDRQTGLAPGRLGLVLFLNNCTDDTAAIVAGLVPALSIPVRVIERVHAGAHAGWARRAAMGAAVAWLEAEGTASTTATLLTTDADSIVPPDWVAANLAALEAGADAVAGRVELIPEEAALLPPSLPARGRLEDTYDALITEMEARIDPDPHDPWPCHRTTIGASLAVRLPAYRDVGGMPEIPLGEDGAFVGALLQRGFRVRHDRAVLVLISARLTGRAAGGVADTIRSRCEEPDALCDARMEAVPRALHRYVWRARLRRLHDEGRLTRDLAWARRLGIPEGEARRIAALSRVGEIVAAVDRASPRLAYRPLMPRQLPGQIRFARLVLPLLRAGLRLRRSAPSARPVAPTATADA
ncbi:glycosyltransferase [Methylobacterium sp. J-043]|nr:glycosyltransferase [Methylobacterium sp. J-043]